MSELKLETVADVDTVKTALTNLIEYGYKTMGDTDVNEAGALDCANEWSVKIDSAKKLLKQL